MCTPGSVFGNAARGAAVRRGARAPASNYSDIASGALSRREGPWVHQRAEWVRLGSRAASDFPGSTPEALALEAYSLGNTVPFPGIGINTSVGSFKRPRRRPCAPPQRTRRLPRCKFTGSLPHARGTSSVQTRKSRSVFGPKVVVIATSAASRPRASNTLPIRGTLFLGSNVRHSPPR